LLCDALVGRLAFGFAHGQLGCALPSLVHGDGLSCRLVLGVGGRTFDAFRCHLACDVRDTADHVIRASPPRLCNAHSFSPHRVLSPRRAATLDRANRHARRAKRTWFPSTQTINEVNLEKCGRSVKAAPLHCPKLIDKLSNSFTCHPVPG